MGSFRKMLTKEVTSTSIKIAKLEMIDGKPEAVHLPDLVLIGNVKQERAQREVEKMYGKGISVFEVHPNTQVYEMPVDEFIKVASIKTV